MQTKEKKLLIAVAILIIVFALTFIYMKKTKNNEKKYDMNNNYITNEALNKDYEIDGIKITNIALYSDENESKFTGLITNNTDHDLNISDLTVIFSDKDDNTLLEGIVLYKTKLLKNGSQYINLKGDIDSKKIANIKFSVNYE